ncbi:MAG: hypothetical protein HY906_20655 [Deltaproteobacteria bacterium]|nr:hypothetical protein [Deltaproteobacteria bacterium]
MNIDRSRLVTTVSDIVLRGYGERYESTNVEAQIADLWPLGQAYAGTIPGYDAKFLAELGYVRELMPVAAAERRTQRKAGKEAARIVERKTVRQYKWVLRVVAAVLGNAIDTRPPVGRQNEEARDKDTAELRKGLAGLGGAIRHDAVGLRNRLEAAQALCEDPRLKTRVQELQGRETDLPAQIRAGIAALPKARETKKTEQQKALTDTADQDVLDGIAYLNLKALCTAGRAFFQARGDLTRAALFNLDRLNGGPAHAPATPTPAPGSPTPAPAPHSPA